MACHDSWLLFRACEERLAGCGNWGTFSGSIEEKGLVMLH